MTILVVSCDILRVGPHWEIPAVFYPVLLPRVYMLDFTSQEDSIVLQRQWVKTGGIVQVNLPATFTYVNVLKKVQFVQVVCKLQWKFCLEGACKLCFSHKHSRLHYLETTAANSRWEKCHPPTYSNGRFVAQNVFWQKIFTVLGTYYIDGKIKQPVCCHLFLSLTSRYCTTNSFSI